MPSVMAALPNIGGALCSTPQSLANSHYWSADKVVRWCADGDFCVILGPVFPASRVQHISDLHSKFALRPHYVWKYGRHPLCDR